MQFITLPDIVAQAGAPAQTPVWSMTIVMIFIPAVLVGIATLFMKPKLRNYGFLLALFTLLMAMILGTRAVRQVPPPRSVAAQSIAVPPPFATDQHNLGPYGIPVDVPNSSPPSIAVPQGSQVVVGDKVSTPVPSANLARSDDVIRAPDPDFVAPIIAEANPAPATAVPPPSIVAQPAPTDDHVAAANPAPRPAWTNGGGRQLNGEYYLVVQSVGMNIDQCWNDVYNYHLRNAVQTYTNDRMNGRGWWLDRVPSDLARQIIVDQYIEPTSTYGNVKLYLKVAFPESARVQLENLRVESLISWRMTLTAVTAAILFGFIGVLFGYLKLDSLTQGQHRVKLQVLSGVLVAGLIACSIITFAIFVDTEHWHGGMDMF